MVIICTSIFFFGIVFIFSHSETVTIELAVTNPLKVALILRDVTLLWRFVAANRITSSAANGQQPAVSNEADYCLVVNGYHLTIAGHATTLIYYFLLDHYFNDNLTK